jgi:hypothetical protein
MKKRSAGMTAEDLDRLFEGFTTDAYADDGQLWAFHSTLEDGIELPCDAFASASFPSARISTASCHGGTWTTGRMHGFGLCLWRLGRFEEAERVFERMLWLNPPDNQGVRFLIDDVRAKTEWEDREVA